MLTPRLTLLTKPGCEQCEEARTALAAIAADLGVEWSERDASREDDFNDRLPVVLLDGREHSYWTVDERRLRRDLAD